MLRSAAFSLALVALLGACANPDEGPSRRQSLGALGGAAAGAALGTLAGGNDARNALIGAGIGLIAGAAVGTYLDDQERRLNQDLEGTGAEVRRVGDQLMVILPEGVTFAVDSAAIKPRFEKPLNRVAATLIDYPSSYLNVVGHTDSTGSAAYNQRLSERRAKAVAEALIDRGVRVARLTSEGWGETKPIASNATREGRARNRRVELIITPATSG